VRLLNTIWFKLRCLFTRRRKEAELAEELRAHLEMQVDANLAAGMPPEEARFAALRQLGGVEQAKELYRDEWNIRWLEAFWRDVRHSVRVLRARPGFTVVAIATLALGIGTSTAVFSLVETILLRPLPYPNPAELVQVEFTLTRDGSTNIGCSVPELDDLGTRAGVFAEVSMVFPMSGNLTGVAEPQRIEAMAVSPNYFHLLGVTPALGRTFGEEEASVPGWAQGCVLSHAAWMNHFGGDPAVLGKKFYMDYDTFRVVGVMPPDFRHPGRTLEANVDVWFTGGLRTPPFTPEPKRDYRIIPGVIGRLAPGMAFAEAHARLDEFATRVRADFPRDYNSSERWTPRVQSLQASLVGDVRGTIWLLFGAVLLVLLICCATVANLLLVRSLARRQEMAVRCALGASRGVIVRQLLAESLMIALAGGAGGLALAWSLPPLLLALAPVSVPHLNEVAVNGTVLGFALLISVATGLIFGLAPAWRASRFDLVPDLAAAGRTAGANRATQRWRLALVAAQVAWSMVLLAGAGLLLRSFWQAWQTNPGFRPDHVLTGRLWLPPPSDPQARQTYLQHENRTALIRELVRRFQAIPGVEDAAISTALPLAESVRAHEFVIETGAAVTPTRGAALITPVTPGYFRTLGIPLQAGRVFDDADDGRNLVAIVNVAAANRFWGGQDPIGRRIGRGSGSGVQWWTVVGVVGNVKAGALDGPDHPQIHLPAAQESWLGLAFCVRAPGFAADLLPAVRREIHAIDADLPIYAVTTMDERMARSLAPRRFVAIVVGVFAGVSLLLAGLGIYGVIALTVTQRRREIGVRIALGATRGQVVANVLRQGFSVVTIGIGAGALAGAAIALGIRGWLFQTHPLDPATWLAIALLLFSVAFLACWLPARRAARVDPMAALRSE
jgi:putative ABC transport system permease protein